MTSGDPTTSSRLTIWAISEYYPPNFSGAAIQAQRILCRLVQLGYNVHVLTAADQAARSLAGRTDLVDGVQVHYLPVLKRRAWSRLAALPPLGFCARSANDYLRDASFHRQIRATLRKHAQRGDILQWYVVGDSTWSVIRLSERMGWRNVIQISLIGADDPSSFRASLIGVSTALKGRCFLHADCVVGLSRALTESCLRFGVPPDRVQRIPNGVDLREFDPHRNPADVRRTLGLEATRRYVAFVGSAIHRKGIDVVIPAFLKAASDHADIDLLVIGPCDFRDATRHDPTRQWLVESLRSQAASAGLESRIHWIGQIDNVPDYLVAADLFFFPTRREGLPNAVAEAMASGLPVVASRLEGITTDLIDDGIEGRLINGHDPHDYAEALNQLLAEPDRMRQMGQAARARIERDYDLNHVVQRYVRVYDGLTK